MPEKMICVEGYRAFRGTMRITPKNPALAPIERTGDWLYKPDTNCWYGGGASYCAEICEVIAYA